MYSIRKKAKNEKYIIKYWVIPVFLLFLCQSLFSQSKTDSLLHHPANELYLNITLHSKEEVQELAKKFSIDRVTYDAEAGEYHVKLWLHRNSYVSFADLNIPFDFFPVESPKSYSMAVNYEQMIQWDRYPTYSTYLALMDSFQTQYPGLCKIDTILSNTPGGHAILAAHLSGNVHARENKPQFFYSSTMHGNELAGYHLMLRLIDYLLSNYQAGAKAGSILNEIDLWICPLENPDGTYSHENNVVGNYPYSIRANSNGSDLNRSYPSPTTGIPSSPEPEVAAMMSFAENHDFVMSANFHGGSELVNYPWDAWTSSAKSHPDTPWWILVSREFADSCHFYGPPFYFTDEDNGITNGGDWYIANGSRQDYMNYYRNCRELTVELSYPKAIQTEGLSLYWNSTLPSMLNYMQACLYGFRGIVTDAFTGEPIKAKVFINNHDETNSHVYSSLPVGNYHRPIKGGSYSVTFSADCYIPQTFTVNVSDKQTTLLDVELEPVLIPLMVDDQAICYGCSATFDVVSDNIIRWYETSGATSPLYTGNTFTTPSLTSTTTYWVEESEPTGNVTGGDSRVSAEGGFFSNSAEHGLYFSPLKPFRLVSFRTNAQNAGIRHIELRNPEDLVIDSRTVYIPGGVSRVTLNMDIPGGEQLKLIARAAGSCNLYRNNQNCQYPYNIGNSVIITKSTATGSETDYYYYFYDWEIIPEACSGTRSPVTVNVSAGIPTMENPVFSVYPNPANHELSVQFSQECREDGTILLYNTLGEEITSFFRSGSEDYLIIPVSQLPPGVYFMQFKDSILKFIKK